MPERNIITIDEQKCNGCGLCVAACAESAIEIRDGKARLVSDAYCDGLGACLGQCPPGAITVVKREAAPFDECARHAPLGNWPIQLRLVPPNVPCLSGADVLLVADCVAFALADFHRRLVRGRPVLIGCPKLDDAPGYVQKLAQIMATSSIRSLTVVHMQVPCCSGLLRIAESAKQVARSNVPLEHVTISIDGEILPAGKPTGTGSESLAVPIVRMDQPRPAP